jgi:tRNA U34 5-methylaminomethyl-2-thiouridine-forming methyltransferase MnmC
MKPFTSVENYQWVETGDGSFTLFSERFQESCHSTTGARAETLLHYVNGCRIKERSLDQTLSILEVGFGLGLGFLTTLEELKDSPHPFHFLSLEIDENLVRWFMQAHSSLFSEVIWEKDMMSARHSLGRLEVFLGDARLVLPEKLKSKHLCWNAIYQDAFSPKKNPALWTVEWFTLLKTFSSQDVILSTYSASSSIRKSMIEAGWKLQKGEKFGPKRTSTRATLSGETDPEISLHLTRSPAMTLTDANMETYGK